MGVQECESEKLEDHCAAAWYLMDLPALRPVQRVGKWEMQRDERCDAPKTGNCAARFSKADDQGVRLRVSLRSLLWSGTWRQHTHGRDTRLGCWLRGVSTCYGRDGTRDARVGHSSKWAWEQIF